MMEIVVANGYFSNRLNSDAWETAPDAGKEKALATAERHLEPYRNRVDNTRFFYAICEQALWLLKGDSRAELQQAGVANASIGKASESYNLRGRPPDIAPQAWACIKGPVVKAGGLA